MRATSKLPKLIATSVVRGSQQGEGHGGVFTVHGLEVWPSRD